MFLLRLFPYILTLDDSNHVLSAWQVDKKKKNSVLKSETLNLFSPISREVVLKYVHETIPNRNMEYDQSFVPDTAAVAEL